MSNLSENPEVKARIRAVFLKFMYEMPYQKITIKKLVEELGMSRQNFYRYYISKDDILLDIIDNTLDLAYQIVDSNVANIHENLSPVAADIIELMVSSKDLINEIIFSSNQKVVFTHIQGFVRRVVGRILRERNLKSIDHDYLDIIISQFTGSGYHLLKCWAQPDNALDSEKLHKMIIEFLEGFLRSLEDDKVLR
ncbi:MAG: TetR/AcrR family transcriptional regulator [Pseudomonadales bacterium]|nr:TetR/AcrR family transcriptional regulator [Pseudomonadales bacterium]